MKILFCNSNGLHPYGCSGAEKTIYDFLLYLCNNYDVLSINCIENYLLSKQKFSYINNHKIIFNNKNFKKIFFCSKERFYNDSIKYIIDYKPNIIFSQLNYLEQIFDYVIKINNSCKIVFFQHGEFKESEQIVNILETKYVNKIICCSQYVKNTLPSNLQKKAFVVYPYFDKRTYKIYDKDALYHKDKVLFFNPIKNKGAEIVIELALKMPNINFQVFKAYNIIENKYTRKMSNIKNINVNEFELSIKKIYKEAKLVIFPSIINEGLGRVIIEAQINHIPVIASNLGGINEAINNKYLLIDNFLDVYEWYSRLNYIFNSYNNYVNLVNSINLENSHFFDCDLNNIIF